MNLPVVIRRSSEKKIAKFVSQLILASAFQQVYF